MKGFMKSLKVPNIKMSPLSQFIFLLAILVVSLLLKSIWDYWMNKWNLKEGFDIGSNYDENTTMTNMKYYSNDNKKLYVLKKDANGYVLFVDLDNGLLLNYKTDEDATTRTYPVYRREYGSEAEITISGELSENQSTEISRVKNQSLYNNGYMKTFTDMSNIHVAYMPFGNATLVHVFDDNVHIKTRFFDGNKNVYPSGTGDDPVDSYLPGKAAPEDSVTETEHNNETFTTMTTENIGGLGYQNEVYRVDTGVYLDPKNGYLVLYNSETGATHAYENNGTKLADPTAEIPTVSRTGFNGWAVNGITDDYFVVYMDTSIKTMAAKVQLTDGEWKISKILRLQDGKVKTSDESLTESTESKTSESNTVTGNGQCEEGHLEMKMAGLTMCVPTAQFFGAMFGGQSSTNGVGSEFIRKTEVVPPVCPQCPQCPGGKNGEVCTNCGGNGGSGTKDNSVGSLVRGAGEGGTSLLRDAGTGASSMARDTVGGAANMATNAVTGTAGMATNAVTGTAGMATNAVKGTVGLGTDAVKGTTGMITDGVQGTVGLGKDAVTDTVGLGREVVGGAGSMVSGAAGAIGSGIGSVGRGIGNLGNGGYQQQQQQGGVYGQGYMNSYGGPNVNRNVAPGMDPYSYYGAVPQRGSCNYMPRTADFSSFGR